MSIKNILGTVGVIASSYLTPTVIHAQTSKQEKSLASKVEQLQTQKYPDIYYLHAGFPHDSKNGHVDSLMTHIVSDHVAGFINSYDGHVLGNKAFETIDLNKMLLFAMDIRAGRVSGVPRNTHIAIAVSYPEIINYPGTQGAENNYNNMKALELLSKLPNINVIFHTNNESSLSKTQQFLKEKFGSNIKITSMSPFGYPGRDFYTENKSFGIGSGEAISRVVNLNHEHDEYNANMPVLANAMGITLSKLQTRYPSDKYEIMDINREGSTFVLREKASGKMQYITLVNNRLDIAYRCENWISFAKDLGMSPQDITKIIQRAANKNPSMTIHFLKSWVLPAEKAGLSPQDILGIIKEVAIKKPITPLVYANYWIPAIKEIGKGPEKISEKDVREILEIGAKAGFLSQDLKRGIDKILSKY